MIGRSLVSSLRSTRRVRCSHSRFPLTPSLSGAALIFNSNFNACSSASTSAVSHSSVSLRHLNTTISKETTGKETGNETGKAATDVSHSPTSKIRSKHQFEEQRLIQYLQASNILPLDSQGIRIDQFSHGQSNPTFVLECDIPSEDGSEERLGKRRIVIRKQPPGKLLKG